MDFKTMAISATLAGSVLLTGLTFSGTINLSEIKERGFDWADKVGLSVQESKDMLSKFNLFKADVTAQLNEKIAKINSLNAKIADLLSQVGNGDLDLETANNEIARLNEQLEQANAEIEALKNEFGLKDSEVQAAFAELQTDEAMDTTLTLDEQNADTVIETPAEPTNDYATEETAITASIQQEFPQFTDLVVAVTDTTVTISAANIGGYDTLEFKSNVDSVLTPKIVTGVASSDMNTIVYAIN